MKEQAGHIRWNARKISCLILLIPGLGIIWASLVAQMVKNLPSMQETWVHSLGWEDPWRREWLPNPVFLPGEFHGQRSLVGYSSRSHREWDMTELLTHTHTEV